MTYTRCERCGHTLLWAHGELVCARRGCDDDQTAQPPPPPPGAPTRAPRTTKEAAA